MNINRWKEFGKVRTVGIISEYNPFHNGHKHQLDSIRSRLDCTLVAVMSPNFVQRGGGAMFDKYERARAAVCSGIDVCVSLPFVFANLSAEGFAEAGVKAAYAMGVDTLSFGAECDSVDLLSELAALTSSESYSARVMELCEKTPSLSLIKAGEEVVRELLGDKASQAIAQPNNILALEYVKAIRRLGLPMDILPIKREGEGYKSIEPSPLPSASCIRHQLDCGQPIDALVPDGTAKIYQELFDSGKAFDRASFSQFARASLLLKPSDELDACIGSRELSSRLIKAIRQADTLDTAIERTVTTRFTRSRITRAIISTIFGISHNEFMHGSPEFLQLLGFSDRGRRLLAERRHDNFPIVTKPADLPVCRQAELERLADGIWSSFMKCPEPYDYFIKKSPFVKGQ